MKFQFHRLLIALVLSAMTTAGAQTRPAPWEGKPFTATPTEITAAATAIKPNQDAGITMLLEERHIAYDAAGRTIQTSRRVYRVESTDAVAHWGTVSATWSPWRQDRPEVKARVIAPDGSVSILDSNVLTDSPRHDQRPVIYEDQRVYSGPLPNVVVGSIVEKETKWTDNAPLATYGVQRQIELGGLYPVLHTMVEITIPSSVPLKYKVRNAPGVSVSRTVKDDRVTVQFDQGPLEARERTESNLPADFDAHGAVEYSTGTSWNAVASGYYKDIGPAVRPNDVQAVIQGTSGLKGEALLQRVLTNLHDKVRYTGLEFGASALIPRPSGEVMNIGYGDCKDKATVLVSALKALGIPASVALLQVRGDNDTDPELPGIGMFDHAIVVIPGNPDIWIDATAEFNGPGDLPWNDQGRLALIIDPATTALVRTPIQSAAENILQSTREFYLAEYGPARVIETLEGVGAEDARFRYYQGHPELKETHESLERYVKNTYLADALSGVDHSASRDLSKPFRLKLQMAKARRGMSDLNNALVAVRLDGLMWGYPDYVLSDDGTDKTEQPGWKPRKNDVEIQPFSTEWTYKIVPPPGFGDPVLPKDSDNALGPAKLTQHYSVDKSGMVIGVVKFDSGKARYTPSELKALRVAAHSLNLSGASVIVFRHRGAALMAEGKAREALAVYTDLIKLHPKEGLHHLQISSALLSAGFGEEARNQAKLAQELDPSNPLVWATLGWTLQHDAIGRRFGTGFDLVGAIAAYRKAIELDPKEWTYRADLAILLEHDKYGERYSSGANLEAALAEYRALKSVNREKGEQYDDNILFALFYSRNWKDLLTNCATLSPTPTRSKLKIAGIAARDGAEQALVEAARMEADERQRGTLLVNAGEILMRVRLYLQALELWKGAVSGQEDSSQLRARIQRMSNIRPYEKQLVPVSDPRWAVQGYFLYFLNPEALPTDVFQFSVADPADQKAEAERIARTARQFRTYLRGQDLAPAVARDLTISNLQMTVEGDDKNGYRVRARTFGERPQTMLIARTEEGYRIIALDSDVAMAGAQVLRYLSANQPDRAKRWLDWVREQQSLSSGDDPFAGPVFPRFWTRGDEGNPERMKLAGLALLSDSSAIRPYVDELNSARVHADPADAVKLDLLLARAAIQLKDWKLLHGAAARLFEANPTSDTALEYVTTAAILTGDWDFGQKAVAIRLARIADDVQATRSSAALADGKGNFARVRAILREMIDNNRAEMNDYNLYTWSALFLAKVTDEDVSMLQRAIADRQNGSFAEIHTLACLYAEVGKTKEARELLLRAMDSGGLDVPNEAIWFGFGRIAEQFGLRDVALSFYQRVTKTENAELPSSTYQLARFRETKLREANGTAKAAK